MEFSVWLSDDSLRVLLGPTYFPKAFLISSLLSYRLEGPYGNYELVTNQQLALALIPAVTIYRQSTS